MKYIIRKIEDKTYLTSAEQDTWTENKEQAVKLNLGEEVQAEIELLKKYKYSDFEVFDI